MEDQVLVLRGANKEAFLTKHPSVLLEGPAGTGKSLALLAKAVLTAEKYPRCQIGLIRQTRASMTQTVLKMLEDEVFPPGHPANTRINRASRQTYVFPNGSEIFPLGLDNPIRIMSGNVDMMIVFESTELSEEGWEFLETRCRGKGIPFNQIIADCNPAQPSHWLNRRASDPRKKMLRLRSRHRDNPYYHDGTDWTESGRLYLERLSGLSGARKSRLLDGLWVAQEGMVYPEWDPTVHIVPRKGLPTMKYYLGGMDFGYKNPGSYQLWGFCGEGNAYLVRQLYMSQRPLADWWIPKIKAVNEREIDTEIARLRAIVCDSAEPEKIDTMLKEGLPAMKANKDIILGLDTVRMRLKPGPDKKPAMFIVDDSLHEVDPLLADSYAPMQLQDEVESYVWDKDKDDRNHRELPVKNCDHAMDCMRYVMMQAPLYSGGNMILTAVEKDKFSSRPLRLEEGLVPYADEDENPLLEEAF